MIYAGYLGAYLRSPNVAIQHLRIIRELGGMV